MNNQFEKWRSDRFVAETDNHPSLKVIAKHHDQNPAAGMMGWLKNWNQEDITCLLFDQLDKGEKGHVFFFTDAQGKEHTFIVRVNVYEEVKSKQYDDPKEFDDVFASNMRKEHYIVDCDDPIHRLLGFVVLNSEGATWHYISQKTYVTHAVSTI